MKWTRAPDEALWQYKFVQLEKDYTALEQQLRETLNRDSADAECWRRLMLAITAVP